jgi:glycosyltransferase involved in cell wall biosynthesis
MKKDSPARNLLIDCSFFTTSWGEISSLALYAVRLVQGFLQYGHYQVYVLMWRDKEVFFDKLIGLEYNKIVLDQFDQLSENRLLFKLFGILPRNLKKELKSKQIQTVILPTHLQNFFFFPRPFKYYTVVHDLFEYDLARERRGKLSYFIWRLYHWFLMRKFPHLISISQATHDDLLRQDGRNSKIVHNSLAFDFKISEQSVDAVRDKKYILDINRFPPYKNTELLIRALGLLKDRIPHILYLKGDHFFDYHRQYLQELVSELNLEDRVIFDIDFRTEGEIRYLYSHADLFVSPSLKEGFGWTPIEAAILRIPVLVSDLEVFKEVTCGKIPTFDPYSPEDLAAHIKEILDNPPSMQERNEVADFFLEEYSLKKQIERLEEILA